MPINNVQAGVIAQNEFAKLLVIGSDGRLEVSWPMTDDERRDAEVHIGGKFGGWTSFQVKAATHLQRPQSRVTPMLTIPFTVPEHRLISDPRFWYYFPLLSLTTAGFVDPQYLVDSTKVHQHAAPRLRDGVWHFTFQANTTWRSCRRPNGQRAHSIFRPALQSSVGRDKNLGFSLPLLAGSH
jgi:hypothetical protein